MDKRTWIRNGNPLRWLPAELGSVLGYNHDRYGTCAERNDKQGEGKIQS